MELRMNTSLQLTNDLLYNIRDYMVRMQGERGERLFKQGAEIPELIRYDWYKAAVHFVKTGDPSKLIEVTGDRKPVDIETFILNPYYLGLEGQVAPTVMKALKEMNDGTYQEALLTGAIGTAKTTLAVWSTAYQLYLISCMKNPQHVYGLDKSSEIVFILQSISMGKAKGLNYGRLRSLIEGSQYFREEFPFNVEIESELRFPNRVMVKPVSGAETAAIGENVIGGIIDELNYMAVVDKSKASIDGGTYDQAVALYNSIARRRKSRFMRQGKMPGLLCLVSSKRYPGQFTDTKEDEHRKDIEQYGKSDIFLWDMRIWDVFPDRFADSEWFDIFIGDEARQPRILEEDEAVEPADRNLVMQIPEEYRHDFEKDIMNALREVAGISTLASHPFMMDVEAISDCFTEENESVLSRTAVDFEQTQLMFYPKRFKNLDAPRWCHIDLAVTGDSAGVVIGHVPGFKTIPRGEFESEILPIVNIDCTLEVKPPKGKEILFYKIRSLLYKLRELGLNIKWVSFDSYQSTDSLQILSTKGFTAGRQSMDVTSAPYDILKTAIYDGRLNTHEHKKLLTELKSLERDQKTGKIDHPPTGSKDVADALAGVVYGLSTRREVWVKHGVSLNQIPVSIKQVVVKTNSKMEAER